MSEHGIPGIVMASAMHQVHSCQEYTEVSEMAQVAGIVSELSANERVKLNILNILISPLYSHGTYIIPECMESTSTL